MPRALKDTACDLFAQLIRPLTTKLPFFPPEYKQLHPLGHQEGAADAGDAAGRRTSPTTTPR